MTDRQYQKMCDSGRPLTDADIVRLEREDKGVECTSADDRFPPIFVFSDRRISQEGAANIKRCVENNLRPGKVGVFDRGLTVYQFNYERRLWEPLVTRKDD